MLQQIKFCWALVLISVLFGYSNSQSSDPSYDHQTTTYVADAFPPVSVLGQEMTITPYFSPDTAVDVEVEFVEAADTTLDIANPSLSSWSGCDCAGYVNGCSVAQLRWNESFPLFAAILNAINRGVSVRILSNYYNTPCASGLIDMPSFWALAGAEVKYYVTTTFMHSKYMQADNSRASVSSINFSHESFMENREAGVIIEGANVAPALAYLTSVFESDFKQAVDWPTLTYNEQDMEIITNKDFVPLPLYEQPYFPEAYVTKLNPITAVMDLEVFTSPNHAWNVVSEALDNTTSSFELFIYQVTSDDFCEMISNFSSNLSTFKMLVSNEIFSKTDWEAAYQCYKNLYYNNVYFRRTASNMYGFSHQKFWILDTNTVFLSTGNWSPSDFPPGSDVFPPYQGNENSWRNTNRDFNVRIYNDQIASQFRAVLDADYNLGEQWKPYDDNI